MNTVYEFGNLQFFKDLVFGWTFIQEGTSYPVSQMDFAQITKVQSLGRFPAYVPEDFYTAVSNKKKELSQAEGVSSEGVSENDDLVNTRLDLKNPITEPLAGANRTDITVGSGVGFASSDTLRSKDRSELLATILENMAISEDGRLVAELQYCTISRKLDSPSGLSLVWKLTPVASSSLKVQLFASIDDLATWVLRKFW